MHQKLRELFIDIAIYTHNNLTNQTDSRPLQPSPKPPIPTPPFELFLSFASQQYLSFFYKLLSFFTYPILCIIFHSQRYGSGAAEPYTSNPRYSQIAPVSQTASLYNIPPVYSSSPTPQTGSTVYGSPSPPQSSSPYMSSPSHASVYNAPPPPGAFSDRASMPPASFDRMSVPPPPSSSVYSSNGYDEYL